MEEGRVQYRSLWQGLMMCGGAKSKRNPRPDLKRQLAKELGGCSADFVQSRGGGCSTSAPGSLERKVQVITLVPEEGMRPGTEQRWAWRGADIGLSLRSRPLEHFQGELEAQQVWGNWREERKGSSGRD